MNLGLSLGLGARSVVSGPAFDPATLFAASEEGAFYNLNTDTTFTDTARTTPATLTASVAGVSDLSGNAVHLAQATAGNRPTLQESGSQYLLFDGTNDNLTAATTFAQVSGSVMLVFNPGDVVYATGRRCLLSFADTATTNNWLELGIDTDRRIYVEYNSGGTLTAWRSLSLVEQGQDCSLVVVYDGADLFMSFNGEQEPIVDLFEGGAGGWFGDVSGGDTLTLGAANSSAGAARFFSGRIYSALIVETEVF
jgi:hypothetical protein